MRITTPVRQLSTVLRLRLAFIPSFLLVLAACSSAATPTPTPTPRPFTSAPCPFNVPFGQQVECGFLEVPEVRADPSSGSVQLAVAVFRAQGATPADDPVVYLAGGPGENALAVVPFLFADLFEPFIADRDLVLFDQRGAGFSEPAANCDEVTSLITDLLDEAAGPDETAQRGIAATSACADRLKAAGVNLAGLNTAESAADVDDLRRALGYEQWNLLGISYGTRLAQTVMRDYPDGVRSVILDSTVPIATDLIADTPRSMDRAFRALFEACARHEACASAYPDLGGTLDRAFDQLNVSPVPGTVMNPLSGEEFESLATGRDLIDTLFQGLYSADVIPLLPELITSAARGDTALLDLLRGLDLISLEFVSTGMQIAVQCQEEVPFTSVDALRRGAEEAPMIRRYYEGTAVLGSDLLETCAYWDLEQAPKIENEPVKSDLPTLILAGELDPITPPAYGESAGRHLSDSTYVLIPSAGHATLTAGGCATSIAQSFLASPTSTIDTSCAGSVPPPPWALPLSSVVMEPFGDPLFGFTGVRPAGWDVPVPGVSARPGLGIMSLLQQVQPTIDPEQLKELFTREFDDSGTAFDRPVSTVDANGLAWQVFESRTRGQVVWVALAEAGQGSALVMATGLPSYRLDLREHLLLPSVREFRVQ